MNTIDQFGLDLVPNCLQKLSADDKELPLAGKELKTNHIINHLN